MHSVRRDMSNSEQIWIFRRAQKLLAGGTDRSHSDKYDKLMFTSISLLR